MAAKSPQWMLDEMVSDYLAGATAKDSAAKHGKDKIVCLSELKRRGVAARAAMPSQENPVPENLKPEILEMLHQGATQRVIAEKFGYAQWQISRIAQQNGIANLFATPAEVELMIGAYIGGATMSEAAALVGKSKTCCQHWLKKKGYGVRGRRISDEVRSAVVADYSSGLSSYKVAEAHGITRSTVCIILKESGVEARGSRVLSDGAELRLVEMYLSGATLKESAAAFGEGWHLAYIILKRRGVPRRKAEGELHGIRMSASAQGIPVSEWTGYAADPWSRFKEGAEYADWRTSVFKRDSFTCADCKQKGGRLEAHHIFKKSEHPHLALIVENGITLCKNCHEAIFWQEEMHAARYLAKIKSTVAPIVFYDVRPASGEEGAK